VNPKVSFIVPCYKLAHVLPECVHSILSQTFGDFEVLVMDDCSPDHTPEVARSFKDPRVIHVRNETNLGHLRNYNKGIGLARGSYLWLISADDILRRPYVVERYARLMEARPEVGYAFCPAVKLVDGKDSEVMASFAHGDRDTVFRGRDFLHKLALGDCVAAPAGMVRRTCYENLSLFPLDLPYAGDWFLWCLFALHYDVAYFAEPMVCHRWHAQNMFKAHQANRIAVEDEIRLRWRIRQKAREAGAADVARAFEDALAVNYAMRLAEKRDRDWADGLTTEEFERSLDTYAADAAERAMIRGRVMRTLADCFSFLGKRHQTAGDLAGARRCYGWAIQQNPTKLKTLARWLWLTASGATRQP